MSVDTIGDFLTVIRNALMISKRSLIVPFSTMKLGIAEVLKEEGYVKDFQKVEGEDGKPCLAVFLKYEKGMPAICQITRISKPGRRSYQGVRKIKRVVGGLGIAILSTNKGIITDKQARKLMVGGEVICYVW